MDTQRARARFGKRRARDIKSGRLIANQGGEAVHRVRLSKVKQLVRGCFHSCGDFTAELSDISAGNVGSLDGWSTVILRTEVGEKALADPLRRRVW